MCQNLSLVSIFRDDFLKPFIIFVVLFFGFLNLKAQTFNKEESFWTGYVYEGKDSFIGDHMKEVVELDMFDQKFDNKTFFKEKSSVSIRYEMTKTFSSGIYELTVGSDYGIRLSIDGGQTYIINDIHGKGFKKSTVTVYLDGKYDLVMEYFNKSGHKRVSFDYTFMGSSEKLGVKFLENKGIHYAKGPFPHDDVYNDMIIR